VVSWREKDLPRRSGAPPARTGALDTWGATLSLSMTISIAGRWPLAGGGAFCRAREAP